MNYKLLNNKLDQFLKQSSAQDIMREFEALGYEFQKKHIKWGDTAVFPQDKLVLSCLDSPKKSFWEKLLPNKKSTNIETPSYSGSFFCLKLQHERSYKRSI